MAYKCAGPAIDYPGEWVHKTTNVKKVQGWNVIDWGKALAVMKHESIEKGLVAMAYSLLWHKNVLILVDVINGTTLQSMMNTKLSQQRFWYCYEIGLIKTIPTIPHNLLVNDMNTDLLSWAEPSTEN